LRRATALPIAVIPVVAVLAAAALAVDTAAACNPEAPVHPVLDDQPYDSLARKVLATQAGTIVIARLLTRMDLNFQGEAGALGSPHPVYQFDIREGWKQPRPRRLTIDGYWIPCDLKLEPGAWFLMFLEGDRPLYIHPAADSPEGLNDLGDIEWFYTQGGELMRPDLVEDVPQSERGSGSP
jgi:hypothetical protein